MKRPSTSRLSNLEGVVFRAYDVVEQLAHLHIPTTPNTFLQRGPIPSLNPDPREDPKSRSLNQGSYKVALVV